MAGLPTAGKPTPTTNPAAQEIHEVCCESLPGHRQHWDHDLECRWVKFSVVPGTHCVV